MELKNIASALVAERFPAARAAVLAGSAAEGTANEFSDLDIVVILDGEPAPFRETTRGGDRLIEWFVHTAASLEYWFGQDRLQGLPTLANMLATGVSLRGTEVQKFQQRAREHLDAGPIPWSEEQRRYCRYLLTDALDDLMGARDRDERDVVAGQVLELATRLRLATGDHWQGKGKWQLRRLRDVDPDLATALYSAHRDVVSSDDRAALVSICEQVLEPLGGRLSEGYVLLDRSSGHPD